MTNEDPFGPSPNRGPRTGLARLPACSMLGWIRARSVPGGVEHPVAFEHHEVGLLTVLVAEASGEPGHRRFRRLAGTEGDRVALRREKHQPRALRPAADPLSEQSGTAGDPAD